MPLIVTHKCPIDGCPIEVRHAQLMCKGHWRLVPKPLMQAVYSTFRKRRGGPQHLASMKQAIDSVEKTLAAWAEQHGEAPAKPEARLPYGDA